MGTLLALAERMGRSVLWAVPALLLLFSIAQGQIRSSLGTAPVWVAEHDWLDKVPGTDRTFEDKYSDWVKSNVDEKIFTSPDSPLYGIQTDCAEAVYAI